MVGQHRLDNNARAVAKRLHDRLVLNVRNSFLDLGFIPLRVGDCFGHGFRNGQAFVCNLSYNGLARLIAIQTTQFVRHQIHRVNVDTVKLARLGDLQRALSGFRIWFAIGAHARAFIHQAIHRNVVALGDAIVVFVVRACDLHSTRPELRVWILICDDWNQTAVLFWPDRDLTQFTDDRRIALVLGVNCNCAITQHGFRPRSRNGDIVALFFQHDVPVFVFFNIGVGFTTRERVFEMPHVPVDFDVLHLKVGDRRLE